MNNTKLRMYYPNFVDVDTVEEMVFNGIDDILNDQAFKHRLCEGNKIRPLFAYETLEPEVYNGKYVKPLFHNEQNGYWCAVRLITDDLADYWNAIKELKVVAVESSKW